MARLRRGSIVNIASIAGMRSLPLHAHAPAKAVGFLASSDAAAITGSNLPVDCGRLAAISWGAYGGLRNDVA